MPGARRQSSRRWCVPRAHLCIRPWPLWGRGDGAPQPLRREANRAWAGPERRVAWLCTQCRGGGLERGWEGSICFRVAIIFAMRLASCSRWCELRASSHMRSPYGPWRFVRSVRRSRWAHRGAGHGLAMAGNGHDFGVRRWALGVACVACSECLVRMRFAPRVWRSPAGAQGTYIRAAELTPVLLHAGCQGGDGRTRGGSVSCGCSLPLVCVC